MLTKLNSIELFGVDGKVIDVEVNVARGKPVIDIIGLPDAAINEAKIRVRTAFKNAKFDFPYTRRITINLAPAEIKKEGPSYDMAFIVGVLNSVYKLNLNLDDTILIGELSLDGKFRHVRGVLSIVDVAKKLGYKNIFIPSCDLKEASLISDINIYPFNDVIELYKHLSWEKTVAPIINSEKTIFPENKYLFDMKYIKGQTLAKRALEIAAAGMHNIIMSGPPGSGKTLLAKTLPSIMPNMTYEETIEVTKLYSTANQLRSKEPLINARPFRNPHHTASTISLIGGGRMPRPGEISLAHRGILFLDEFPEFPRIALETLRQPMEDGMVTISRVETTISYPARFMLVASQNPCPCGYLTDPDNECTCTQNNIKRYQQKVSGPILDRIDIQINVPRILFKDIQKEFEENEDSLSIRERVEKAVKIQNERFKNMDIMFNSEMSSKDIDKICKLEEKEKLLLKNAVEKNKFSTRTYYRILKLAQTIADLEGSSSIKCQHIAEALQFRKLRE